MATKAKEKGYPMFGNLPTICKQRFAYSAEDSANNDTQAGEEKTNATQVLPQLVPQGFFSSV